MNSPATACPDPGVLRAWLDQQVPEGLADPAPHVAVCAGCADTVGDLKFNSTLASAAIGEGGAAALAQAVRAVAASRAAGDPVALNAALIDVAAAAVAYADIAGADACHGACGADVLKQVQ